MNPQLPDAGNYDNEDCFNFDTDAFDKRKLKVKCPCCGRWFAALCSKFTQCKHGGWRWVGDSHKEPYNDFTTHCRKCGNDFKFTAYTSQ